MSAPNQSQLVFKGICKQVLSGDAITIRSQPRGGRPKERQLNLSNVTAPRPARRGAGNADATADEPCAWASREFLRKKLVGKEVLFTVETSTNTGREYGYVYLGADIATGENLVETLVSEGLVQVRRENLRESAAKLVELEDTAKAQGKGKWAPDASSQVRDITWSVENPRVLVEKFGGKPVSAVIEHVRDGSTMRAFLLPDMYHVTVMLSGVRCPTVRLGPDGKPDQALAEPYCEEARFFVESRLLQRDVQIVLESVNNANYIGSVLHPNGNIAELLLRDGFARCVDWSIAHAHCGVEALRSAERVAKEKKLRIWKDYKPSAALSSVKDKDLTGKVVEVVNADAMVIRLPDNSTKKFFLSSVRSPRLESKDGEQVQRPKRMRPLYDIPFLYEAREFLRRKVIGQKVHVHVDYVQPASDNFPEKTCCTIKLGGVNMAEALVSKGLATVVRYRQDEERRSSQYDALLAAEMKAQKSGNGLWGKKENTTVKVQDCAGDLQKSKQFLPFLTRVGRADGIVEFVASGSRMRIYVPRETCLITFLLAGVSCPRGARPGPGGTTTEAEPFGEEAAAFTRDLCLQHEVQIEVDSMDKVGNFIGWLYVDGKNLAVELVTAGLSSMHFSAENSKHYTAIQRAVDQAKAAKKGIWKNYVEKAPVADESSAEAESGERKEHYRSVVITEVGDDCRFFAQSVDKGQELETMMEKMRAELANNPPLAGAYRPKKGDQCAAKFVDGGWYRARVERIVQGQVSLIYVDYGNRATVPVTDCAALPGMFAAAPRYAKEYRLACVKMPKDEDLAKESRDAFADDCCDREVEMNVEYRDGLEYVTLRSNQQDVAKALLEEGLLMVAQRRDARLRPLLAEYQAAQDRARHEHKNIWQYGDITDDDATEFGR
ncbi:LOW QUALITY PROTEIN: staphylococcal nuclease domain-containing protein 1-like [Pollicipes pollicipes]|uniref:LOW QUALITY PROTEIN: staphylococcal nuclease domain-containing protein 1-like n=1 Tax=Pollicipes pollicipes TaxID=41117 RepID=UPI001884EA14|nr:LOW QUALITY PROTEIN: staphylococcal nuclease domain-containing protein 1-like [Pollicipes pollicipes]